MTDGVFTNPDHNRAWTGDPPDPIARPDYYDGIVLRRSMAYLIDVVVVFAIWTVLAIILSILGIITFGLLLHLFPLLAFVPIAYSTLLIGGSQSATYGMRLMGLEVRSWGGDRPNMVQALVMTLLFYATMIITWFFGMLVVFFNVRRRTAHDFLSGVVVVRRLPAPAVSLRQA